MRNCPPGTVLAEATMAHVPAGKTRKGKKFSDEEERSLCRSFLVVSQDPNCGNGQRNFALWNLITAHFNQSKPRLNLVRPARSLKTKWVILSTTWAKRKSPPANALPRASTWSGRRMLLATFHVVYYYLY